MTTTYELDGGTRTLTVHADDVTDVDVVDRRTGHKVHPNQYDVELLKTRAHITRKRGFFGHGTRRWIVTVDRSAVDRDEAEFYAESAGVDLSDEDDGTADAEPTT